MLDASDFTNPKYHFDKTIYDNRVFDSKGVADPSVEIQVWTKHQRLARDVCTSTEYVVKSCFRNS